MFADQAAAEDVAPEPVNARVTRSKRAQLDELRRQHEEMVCRGTLEEPFHLS